MELREGSQYLRRALSLEVVWIVLLFPFVIFPYRVLPVHFQPFVVGALFLFWPLRWAEWLVSRGHRRIDRPFMPLQSAASLSVLVLLLWIPVNLWASIDSRSAWATVGYLAYGIAIFVACINSRSLRERPELIAASFVLIGVILSLVSPFITRWEFQFQLFHVPLYALSELTAGPLRHAIHANVLASGLVIIFPVSLAVALAPSWPENVSKSVHSQLLMLKGVDIWVRLAALLCALLMSVVIILTQSRSAYLATVGGLITLLILRWPKSILVSLLALIGFLVITQTSLVPSLSDWSMSGLFDGWHGRINIWQNSVRALRDFSFTGIGIGSFAMVMPALYPLRYDVVSYPHAHNLWLQVGLEHGIPGLIAYISILLTIIAILIQAIKVQRGTLGWSLNIGLLSAIATLVIDGVFSSADWGLKLTFLQWLVLALAVLLHRLMSGMDQAHYSASTRHTSGSFTPKAP